MFDYEADKSSRIGWKAILGGCLVLICFGLAAYCIGYAFKHPDKTHTQLFLDLWPLELLLVLCGSIGSHLYRRKIIE